MKKVSLLWSFLCLFLAAPCLHEKKVPKTELWIYRRCLFAVTGEIADKKKREKKALRDQEEIDLRFGRRESADVFTLSSVTGSTRRARNSVVSRGNVALTLSLSLPVHIIIIYPDDDENHMHKLKTAASDQKTARYVGILLPPRRKRSDHTRTGPMVSAHRESQRRCGLRDESWYKKSISDVKGKQFLWVDESVFSLSISLPFRAEQCWTQRQRKACASFLQHLVTITLYIAYTLKRVQRNVGQGDSEEYVRLAFSMANLLASRKTRTTLERARQSD